MSWPIEQFLLANPDIRLVKMARFNPKQIPGTNKFITPFHLLVEATTDGQRQEGVFYFATGRGWDNAPNLIDLLDHLLEDGKRLKDIPTFPEWAASYGVPQTPEIIDAYRGTVADVKKWKSMLGEERYEEFLDLWEEKEERGGL